MTGWMFLVDAAPVAQPRLAQVWKVGRSGRLARGAYVRPLKSGVEHPVIQYKKDVLAAARKGRPEEWCAAAMMWAVIDFVFPRPKYLKMGNRARAVGKCDLDNLLKAFWDALRGEVFDDDRQIASVTAEKWYAAAGEAPHVRAEFWSY